jgi:hypothetical protein
MKRHNLSLHSDYTEVWAKAAKERERVFKGIDPARKYDIARALNQGRRNGHR